MTRRVWIVTHADVTIDPSVAVPEWGLNARGRARHESLARHWAATRPPPDAVWSSGERKAREGAAALAKAFGHEVNAEERLGENDRSATGYIPEPEFSAVAAEFLARPGESVRGWERAFDAQARILGALARVVDATPGTGEIAVVTHGGVATLLVCAARNVAISTDHAPGFPGGGGICAIEGMRLVRGWRAIEATDALSG